MEPLHREAADDEGCSIAPLFPLPNVFLFPGCVMPLHIFEPRYRQMIEDLLDTSGRLVMGTQLESGAKGLDGSCPGMPPVFHTAGLGEIARHERMRDGRFLIYLIGLKRVKIREKPSNRLYRKVQTEPFHEIALPDELEPKFRRCLQQAILERCPELLNLPTNAPISFLADLLLQRMQLPQSTMQRLYAEPDVRIRAEGALEEHMLRPAPPASGSKQSHG